MTCTCHFEDVGDAENGPRLSMDPDEACPNHGREAMPDEWAEGDRIERGYILSSIHASCVWAGADTGVLRRWLAANEDVALAMHAAVLASFEDGEDDGHDTDRAAGTVADALVPLVTHGRSAVRACPSCHQRVPRTP
jgi:RNA polymerase subunit RPABC4/transcription elongation factor Spt4